MLKIVNQLTEDMKIHHVAIWTQNLEAMKKFYVTYFGGVSNDKYTNKIKGFESYMVRFDNGVSLEIMSRTDVFEKQASQTLGFCHLAFELESKPKLLELTDLLRRDGYPVVGEPRVTGDGYFESVILDFDSNKIELCCPNV